MARRLLVYRARDRRGNAAIESINGIDMKRTLGIVCASVVAASGAVGCDLPELSEGIGVDAGESSGGEDASPGMKPDAGTPSGPDAGTQPAQPGSCDPADWVASASIAHPVNPPSYGIDRLQPTRWTTGVSQSAGQYFQIDFGGEVEIGRVELGHAFAGDGLTDYPRGVEVLVSSNGSSFDQVAGTTSAPSAPGPVLAVDIAPHPARAVRFRLTNADPEWWWTLHDVSIECTTDGGAPSPGGPITPGPDEPLPGTGVNPNRAAWTATASVGDDVGLAFDGNAETRWTTGSSPQYGDEWYELDLGSVIDIRAVWLAAAGSDHPSAYRVSLSTDGTSYQVVATGVGDALTQASFPRQPARHVRIEQIGSGHDAWWSIAELTILE